jgi:alkylation response protein AidB-like acyl-CoA dehydrogenase
MNFSLTEEEKSIQDWARKLSQEIVAPLAVRHSQQKLSTDYLKTISSQGLMTLLVPEAMGGMGLSAVSFALVMKEISKVCGSTGVSLAVSNMIADILVREGSPYQQEKFLQPLIRGETLTASFCLTENSSGSDASALKSRAVKKGKGYELSGEKIYVTNGAFSQFFVVMARTSDEPGSKGVSAFLISRDSKGVTMGKEEDKMGLTGSSTIRMSFENVFVPEENRIGAEGDGFKIAMRALDGGRISVSSQALGIAEASLEFGVRYAKEREAFGKPIADFQAIQWKIADSATLLAAAELLVLQAAYLKDHQKPLTLAASQAKVFATEAAIRVCDEMIQVLGGYGYIREYPVERFYRDVRVTALYEGTSEIQRKVIARELLK